MQVAPTQSLLENAGEEMDVVLLPHSFTSFDLLTEDSSYLRTRGTDYSSKSSF
jgi:alpha-N-arabinofuranosidase